MRTREQTSFPLKAIARPARQHMVDYRLSSHIADVADVVAGQRARREVRRRDRRDEELFSDTNFYQRHFS